jgi:crotonobetainyl-CoA:carnitine CoA-transferase CaiB-like acyl-CoA transferase
MSKARISRQEPAMALSQTITRPIFGRLPPSAGMRPHRVRTRGERRFTAPTLGKDNEYVYNELLGVSDEELAELERLGQIGTTYPKVPR